MLETIGYDPRMARWAAAPDAEVGRVLRVDQGLLDLLTEDGPVRATYGGCLLQTVARDPLSAPAPGDWVVTRAWGDHRHTVERVLPRRSTVLRPRGDVGVDGPVLCANADYVAVVVAAAPGALDADVTAHVDDLLCSARLGGAVPLVVLNRTRLVAHGPCLAAPAAATAAATAAAAAGVEVVPVSTATGAGLDRLRELVAGRRTLALLGAPGQGRSELVAALVGAPVLGGAGSRGKSRGRPSSRGLVPLPGGGAVIDVPDPTRATLGSARVGDR